MKHQSWDPGKLLQTSGEYWSASAIHAAVKLDVFTALGGRGLTAAELAGELAADPRGMRMLLAALAALNLIEKTGNGYANTPFAAEFLSKDSPAYLGHIVLHHHHLMESWAHLDQSVQSGQPNRNRSAHSDQAWRENFLMGMFNLAMRLAPQLVPKIDLTGRRHLLDLGGGPGTWAIHFCRHNPELKATVYDLPTTRPFAEKTIARFSLSERIRFTDGDFIEQGIDGSFDVAWLSHILHAEGPEICRDIIRKAVAALEPGGLIVIHEFILDNTMDGPLFPALFSLNMLLGTPAGQSYSEQQIMNMLGAAGVKNLRRIPCETPNDSGLIAGEV